MITQFRDSLPYAEHGFGIKRNVYVSGRINVSVGENGGIFRLGYLGSQKWNNFDLFTVSEAAVFNQLFRIHILIDDIAYRAEFNHTTHYPFGYRSECRLAGVLIRHELVADDDTIFHRVRVLDNPGGAKVTARICQAYSAIAPRDGRTHRDWTRDFDHGTLSTVVTDYDQNTSVRIGCSGRGIFKPITHQFKAYLLSAEAADEHLFYLTFNGTADRDLSSARLDCKFAEFEELYRQGAEFATGNPAYDSAIRFTPLLMKYLEVPGHPGAFRASPFYWVWGWDSMVHCDALIYTGYADMVRRMLLFFMETADPQYGIHMSYNTDLAPSKHAEPAPVQGFYLIMLYHYYAATGDKDTLERLRPYSHLVAQKIANALVPGVGLVRERGYFPDYPHCIELTNHDFSVINNSVCYQGMRAWTELSGEFAAETAILGNALNRFFDDQEGMWVDSLDGDTLEQRRYYPVFGQLYVSPFALEPHRQDWGRIAAFMKTHLLSTYGIWMLPPDRKGFMADGGQIGEYFPAVDRYYWNMMNAAGDSASIEDHERIVSAFWRNCTYPEGETTDVVNVDPALYEDEPGMKQLFSAKSWAAAAVDLNLGLRWDLTGIHLKPLPGKKDFAIRNLVLRGKKLSFVRSGGGAKLQLSYGGVTSDHPFIAWDQLADGMTVSLMMK